MPPGRHSAQDAAHRLTPLSAFLLLAFDLCQLTALLFIAGLLTYVITSVAGQWQSLAEQFDQGIEQIFDFLENGPLPVTITADDVNGWIDNGRQWLTEHGGDIASQAAASDVQAAASVSTARPMPCTSPGKTCSSCPTPAAASAVPSR